MFFHFKVNQWLSKTLMLKSNSSITALAIITENDINLIKCCNTWPSTSKYCIWAFCAPELDFSTSPQSLLGWCLFSPSLFLLLPHMRSGAFPAECFKAVLQCAQLAAPAEDNISKVGRLSRPSAQRARERDVKEKNKEKKKPRQRKREARVFPRRGLIIESLVSWSARTRESVARRRSYAPVAHFCKQAPESCVYSCWGLVHECWDRSLSRLSSLHVSSFWKVVEAS